MTIQKISLEELSRYRKIREKKAGKPIVPGVITVDVQQKKNMQGRIPVQLWIDVRIKAAKEMISTSKMVELALETYLAMEPEDFQRIKERYEKLLKEEEEKGGG